MAPFIALIITFISLRSAGWLGWDYMADPQHAAQGAVAAMLLIAASGHWGSRRAELVRMVPPKLPRPELIVTMTGWLEIIGAVLILIPATSFVASLGLTLLLAAMFPANVRAAKKGLTIGGKPATPLALRTILQIIFITAILFAGWSAN